MTKITGDEPAMPCLDMNNRDGVDRLELRYEGLTIRQQFAMAALTGICANSQGYADLSHLTKKSVQLADLLIEELNKGMIK